VAIAVESDEQWRGLRRAMGEPEWARDPALDTAGARCARVDLDERVAAWTRDQRKTTVFESCIAEGVPAAPVHRTNHELIDNPQLRSRAYYERVAHPAGGEWWMHGWEWRPAGAGRCVRALAPDFGAHNEEVLREAGFSEAEIADLHAQGVIGVTPIGVPTLPGG
jgi:crotonobetainyl-CoA:carnitine CoA-transferase CaiB-like acyl-CoA transferase